MERLSLSDIAPGMLLVEDLTGPGGRILLAKGTVLTAGHLARLAEWGIDRLAVAAPKSAPSSEPPQGASFTLQAAAFVDHFFQFTSSHHPVAARLRLWCQDRLARRLAEGLTLGAPSDGLGAAAENPAYPDLFLRDEGGPADLVQDTVHLASFPDIYFRILEVIDSPASSASQVAEVVGKDQSLAARLLKLVNSPYYGFARKIDSVTRAVTLVGTRELATLAAGVAAIQVFKDVPPELMDMKTFWTEAVSAGVLCRLIASESRAAASERFFVAGLLSSIGRLVILVELPFAAAQALIYSLANSVPLYLAERETLGFDQAAVAGELFARWRFPEALSDMVVHQYEPMTASAPREAACLHLAVCLASTLAVSRGRRVVVPDLSQPAWESLEISAEAVPGLLDRAETRMAEILSVFIEA